MWIRVSGLVGLEMLVLSAAARYHEIRLHGGVCAYACEDLGFGDLPAISESSRQDALLSSRCMSPGRLSPAQFF